MIYLKSTIAGLAALFLTAALVYIVAILAIALIFRSGGVDLPIWHVHTESLGLWLVVSVVFGLGFFWEFRRLSN
jgi:hypothetical protein